MLLFFAGGHRMGSTFQGLIVLHALKQLGIKYRQPDNAAMNVFHLEKMRAFLKAADDNPKWYYYAKSHVAFPTQVETVLAAERVRIFLVWRDQRDALVSDFHFSQRHAGHVYGSFQDYFWRRGRKVLLRNRLQQVVWDGVEDDRVRAWDYLDLVDNFERSAGEMVEFAGMEGVDIEALKKSVSIGQLRKKFNDPKGAFFRKGGKQDIEELGPDKRTLAAIEDITNETDWRRLGRAFEREDWMHIVAFGRESKEAGLRKTFHWWLFRTKRAHWLRREVLPKLYKLSPRRLVASILYRDQR
ncbi:MAG: sulfotransferase domain-containing protein [Alphaproteobacteria bacterium]|nr:sulfotransferase domain-containing protein [Alphaproteobacteria bacterium]